MVEPSPDIRGWAFGLDKWVVAIIAIHLAVAFPLACHLNIWVDEASSLYASQHGFWRAFETAAVEQKQAPLYFWILSLWREIDGSIFFARAFSVLCSIASIPLFTGLAKRFFDPRGALLVTAFFGLHPFLIWASLEIRVYSLVVLLTIVLLRSFYSTFWEDQTSAAATGFRHLGFFALSVFSLYTNYYLGFLIAGFFAALIFTGRWRAVVRFIVVMAAAALAFLPMVFQVVSEFSVKSGSFQDDRPIAEGIRIIWHHFLTFVFPTEIFPDIERSPISLARLWIVRTGLIALACLSIWKWRGIRSRTNTLLIVVSVIAGFLLASYLLIGSQFIHLRHASVLFVPLILFFASLLRDVWPSTSNDKAWAFALGVAVIFAGLFIYSISAMYPTLTKRGDWVRVAEFIQQNEGPDQPIVLFTPFNALALPYYYEGMNPILPDRNYFDFGLQAPSGTENSLARQNQFVISVLPRQANAIWLVVDEHCMSTDACRPLENYVESHYTIGAEREFYLSKVYLLTPRSQ